MVAPLVPIAIDECPVFLLPVFLLQIYAHTCPFSFYPAMFPQLLSLLDLSRFLTLSRFLSPELQSHRVITLEPAINHARLLVDFVSDGEV